MIFRHVLEQHANLLSFLWNVRARLATDPETRIADLLRFDLRLRGNQDGLLLARTAAEPIAARAWVEGDPGGYFGRALLALVVDDWVDLLDLCSREAARGPLISAFGFARREQTLEALRFLSVHPDALMRAVAARGLRAIRSCEQLDLLTTDAEPAVRVPAIQAAGLARCTEIAPQLHAAARRCEYFLAYWALWLVTGERANFQAMLTAPSPDARLAMCAARLAPSEWLPDHIAEARRDPRSHALAIGLAGGLGWPKNMNWVAEALCEPDLVRLAADVLRVVLGAPDFLAESQANPESGFATWWAEHRDKFQLDERYLNGVLISVGHSVELLRSGRQGIRLEATFEIARDRLNSPILNVEAPAYNQMFALSHLTAVRKSTPYA